MASQIYRNLNAVCGLQEFRDTAELAAAIRLFEQKPPPAMFLVRE
jgi:hypothetical protein